MGLRIASMNFCLQMHNRHRICFYLLAFVVLCTPKFLFATNANSPLRKLFEEVRLQYQSDSAGAIKRIDSMAAVFEKKEEWIYWVSCNSIKASAYYMSDDVEKYFEVTDKLYKKGAQLQDDSMQGSALMLMGVMYNKNKDYAQAYTHFFKALDYLDEKRYPAARSALLNNLSTCLADQKLYDSAINFFRESIKLKLERNDSVPLMNSYMNLANAFIEKKNQIVQRNTCK